MGELHLLHYSTTSTNSFYYTNFLFLLHCSALYWRNKKSGFYGERFGFENILWKHNLQMPLENPVNECWVFLVLSVMLYCSNYLSRQALKNCTSRIDILYTKTFCYFAGCIERYHLQYYESTFTYDSNRCRLGLCLLFDICM